MYVLHTHVHGCVRARVHVSGFFLLTLFHSMFHYKRQYYMLEIAYM